jgi:hypothetical protein
VTALNTNTFRRSPNRVISGGLVALVLLLTATMMAVAVTRFVRTGDGVGGDFLTDYAGGYLVRTGDRTELYDFERQERAQRDLSPAGDADTVNPFVATPAVAWLFAPASALPYRLALALFTVCNLGALIGAAILLRRELAGASEALQLAIPLAFACSMPAITNLSWGQIDLVVVYAGLLGWRFLRADRDVLAGLALSLALLKPHFLVGFVGLLIVQRRWQTLAVLAGMSVPGLVLPALLLGTNAIADYVRLLVGITELPAYIDTQPQHMANWRGLVTGLLGRDDARYWIPGMAILGAGTLTVAIREWRRDQRSVRAYALAMLLPLLLSPHIHMQSMMLLFVAGALLLAHHQSEEVPLLGDRQVDGVVASFALVVVLFVGWFLTANNLSVMVFVTLTVFAWCASVSLTEPRGAQAELTSEPLAAAA